MDTIFSQTFVEKLGWPLLHFIWQGAAVALLVAMLLRILRRSTANLRYIISCVALALMILAPMATMLMLTDSAAYEEPIEAEASIPVAVMTDNASELPAEQPLALTEAEPLAYLADPAPLTWKDQLKSMLEVAMPYLVLGWMIGVLGLSMWRLGGWTQIQFLKRRMVKPVDTSWQEKLTNLTERLGITRTVRMLESALVEVPTVVGWLKPIILIPTSSLMGITPQQLEAILLHELAHIRRFDYLVNLLQTLAETLGFYHPAVWWVSQRIRVERENCCDDLAARALGDKVRYARALATMEETRQRSPQLALAANGSNLLHRVSRLLGHPRHEKIRLSQGWPVLLVVIVAGLILPIQAARTSSSPQDIIELIDQGQQRNRSLAASGQGQVTINTWSNVESQKESREAMREVVKAALKTKDGRGMEISLPEDPITKPRRTSYSTTIYFDKNKLRWNQQTSADAVLKYACDGKVAYSYLLGRRFGRAYIEKDGKKTLHGLGRRYDPRTHSADSHGTTIKESLQSKRKVLAFDLAATEVNKDGKTLYEVVLTFKKNNNVRVLYFDPEKGYEAVESMFKYPDGTITQKVVAEFVQAPSGRWLSKKRIMQFYKVMEENQPAILEKSREFVLDDIEFGPVDPQEFTFIGMEVINGTMVYDRRHSPVKTYRYEVAAGKGPQFPVGDPVVQVATSPAGLNAVELVWEINNFLPRDNSYWRSYVATFKSRSQKKLLKDKSFTILASLDGKKFTKIAKVQGPTNKYVHKGVKTGWLYYYKVQAFGKDGKFVAESPLTVGAAGRNLVEHPGYEKLPLGAFHDTELDPGKVYSWQSEPDKAYIIAEGARPYSPGKHILKFDPSWAEAKSIGHYSNVIPISVDKTYLQGGWFRTMGNGVSFGRHYRNHKKQQIGWGYAMRENKLPQWTFVVQPVEVDKEGTSFETRDGHSYGMAKQGWTFPADTSYMSVLVAAYGAGECDDHWIVEVKRAPEDSVLDVK